MTPDTLTESDVITLLDFEESRECESLLHAEGSWGHSGTAAFIQLSGDGLCSTCCGLRCAGAVAMLRLVGSAMPCPTCGNGDMPRFIPLDNT